LNNERSPLPPEITAVLHMLLSNVQSILADRLIGMYVHGSLACGDFNPQRSDIDFLVVAAVSRI
jgi:streptomycin 3"-adenylyltransferase